MQQRVHATALLWGQDNLVDQRANELHRFVPVLSVFKQVLQFFDLAAVNRRKVRMHRDVRHDVGLCLLRDEARLLCFQFSETRLHRRLVQPVLDRAHDPVDLALNAGELHFGLGSLATCLFRQPVHLLLIRAGKLRHQFWREQVLLQGPEDARLDLLPADRTVVRAHALRAPPGAAIAVLRHDRVPRAAAAAG
nr:MULTISPECIES: hypothetical protein [unclassified Microvirga]